MGILLRFARLAGCLLAALAAGAARADFSVSNNLAAASGGAEAASGLTYLAAGFGSATGGQLASVTLKVGSSAAGAAELALYADDGLNEPGVLLGLLTQVGTVAATPSAVTWTASGITLAANTTYWVVLRALSGTFDWSYTAAAAGAGSGAGYQNTWGVSDDAGASWFTYDSYPTQMNVALASSAAVPEPSSLALCGVALAGLGGAWGRRRWARAVPAPAPLA